MENGTNRITGNENFLDSRSIDARILFLQEIGMNLTMEELEESYQEETEEITQLMYIRDEVIDCYGETSWKYGVTFINDRYFEEYAEDYLRDIGAINPDVHIVMRNLDMAGVARDLQDDYMGISIFNDYFWCQEQS